jgi:hypothetical protein
MHGASMAKKLLLERSISTSDHPLVGRLLENYALVHIHRMEPLVH